MRLPSTGFNTQHHINLGMVAIPVILRLKVEAERLKFQGHSWLYEKSEVSLGYMIPWLNNKNT